MENIAGDITKILNQIYFDGIKNLIVEHKNEALIKDPIFDIIRNRVMAELLKAIIRLNLEKDELVIKFANYLIRRQNEDGSWNEVHPNYDQPSALITAIVGEALLNISEKNLDKQIIDSIHLASQYVLSQQRSPGRFIKSLKYRSNYLNVDATCGAFLSLYGKIYENKKCIEVAKQTARYICNKQSKNGSFPYIINDDGGHPKYNVPCIHYQGVTLYYLIKIDEVIEEKWLKLSLIKGLKWINSLQRNDGTFDWSKSGLMFAYYLSGANAFLFSSFIYVSKWNEEYIRNAILCLNRLKKNMNTLFLRWEKDSLKSLPFSIPTTFRSAMINNYNLEEILFRFGYGMYRQIARRRYSIKIDKKIFESTTKLFNIKTSTIEPFNNYPDLFMTTQIIDCLSYSFFHFKEV